jgi:hypothetical protein
MNLTGHDVNTKEGGMASLLSSLVVFSMVLAALTEGESFIVLASLVFVTCLLIIAIVKMWSRLTALEIVVYAGDRVTKHAKEIIDEVQHDHIPKSKST